MPTRLLRVALICCALTACASAPQPQFIAKYGGSVHAEHLQFNLLKPLPASPTAGWLVSAPPSEAVGVYSSHNSAGVPLTITPAYVRFSAEPEAGKFAAGYFEWDGAQLVICTLNAQFLQTFSGKVGLRTDYNDCAKMMPSN